MKDQYRIPDLNKGSFARTNPQTLAQRAAILNDLLPDVESIVEICCGDCSGQWSLYRSELGVHRFRGIDLHPEIVAANRSLGIDCICGDVLNPETVAQVLDFDVIFFGPPLSVDCDGHRLLTWREVIPGYGDFVQLLLGDLAYDGTFVCICPKSTTLGDVRQLYDQVRSMREEVGLRLIYYSYATITGQGIVTEPRLKYVELWFSSRLEDRWEIRGRAPYGAHS
jgi:hypothetical protein